ncbi:MAG TPA: glutamate 5-kinase [Dongiaceae bacterium]|jgi:glutamate 5-kinase|nr:glutamate 5-kinase [Dongiaceae bacterium]
MVLAKARIIVVKIGSALLVENGALRTAWLETLTEDLQAWRAQKKDVVLVSSGAVALGRSQLNLTRRALKLEEKQAAAAIGQIALAHAYREALGARGLPAAQILLTLDDTEDRTRHLNARGTLRTLLALGTVPIINENDTVATEELRFGDNDRLAARVAAMIGADCLVLLSDIDGLYTADPRRDQAARHVPVIDRLGPAIFAMAGAAGTVTSSGGMVTKLEAARIALRAGCAMAIASGKEHHALHALAQGGKASWFLPSSAPLAARKKWIGGTVRPRGRIVIDPGAVRALRDGKSLLAAGICGQSGKFSRGDAIIIEDTSGQEIARGLSAYDASETEKIAGHNSHEIAGILGYAGRAEIIHRDDLVMNDPTDE